jgi:hypothetical protein
MVTGKTPRGSGTGSLRALLHRLLKEHQGGYWLLRTLLHRLLKNTKGLLALESTAPQVTEKHQGGYWLLRALLTGY